MKLQTLQILQFFYRVQDNGRWCVGAHIQAFTFSSQDHGRLSIVHCVVWCGMCGVRVVCVFVYVYLYVYVYVYVYVKMYIYVVCVCVDMLVRM